MNKVFVLVVALFVFGFGFGFGFDRLQSQDTIPIRIKGEVPVISRHDSLLFRSVFGDSLRVVVDYQTLKFLRNGIRHTESNEIANFDPIATSSLESWSSISGRSWNPNTGKYSQGVGVPLDPRWSKKNDRIDVLRTKSDSINNLASPRKRVQYFANQLYDTLHAHMSFSDGERVRMKNLLKSFRQRARKLPTIYSLIDKEYAGDVDAYVDDLFDKSVFSSKRRLKRFIRTVNNDKKLLRDPLVLYWTSMMQYNVLLMVADIVNE